MSKQSTAPYYNLASIFFIVCGLGFCSEVDDARAVLQSYFMAACVNDTHFINSIITDAAHGTGYIGLRAYYYDKYREMLDDDFMDEHVILGYEKSEDRVKFQVSDPWFNGQERWFFLVLQGGVWKIAAPWEVLCKDYHKVETAHFRVYWNDEKSCISPHLDITPSVYSLNKLEELYGKISNLLQYEIPYKVEYYICASDEQPEFYTNGIEGRKHQGHNSMDSRVCFAITPYNAHIVIHAISITAVQGKTPPHPVSILREGLATAFQWSDARIGHIPSAILVKNMLEENACPTLDSLICHYEQLLPETTYPAAATFILYFLEKYGEEKFRRIWYNHPHDDLMAFIDSLVTICEVEVPELDSAWRNWVIRKATNMDVAIEYGYNQILTANWIETDSKYFKIHHKSYEVPSSEELQQLDMLYENVCDKVALEPLRAIDFYKCSDFDEMYFMFGGPNSFGGLASETTIVSMEFLDQYEIAYSTLRRLGCKYEPSIVGAAFCLGCEDGKEFYKIDSVITETFNKDSMLSLDTAYTTVAHDRSKRHQLLNQWRSFCKYLMFEYGAKKLTSALQGVFDSKSLVKNIERAYIADFGQLERKWQENIRSLGRRD